MIPKSFDNIDKTDIESLLLNKFPEGKAIEYKAALPGTADDNKKEFLADVSSFANAAGGDLVFGVSENEGVPDAIPGLANINVDAELLRLGEIIRDGVQPRIPGVQMRSLDGFESGPVILIRLPRSWVAPHMVTYKKWSRFFTRTSAGKYQMDVGELRNAFAASEIIGERMQRFRTDRLSRIISGETPVRLEQAGVAVLHILPFSPFSLNAYIDHETERILLDHLPLLGGYVSNFRQNLDGMVTSSGPHGEGGTSCGYCQLFRSGAIESVYTQAVKDSGGERSLASIVFEGRVLAAIRAYLLALSTLAVPYPLLVALSMTKTKGVMLLPGQTWIGRDPSLIDTDLLVLPDVLIEQADADLTQVIRPIFDAIWNAAGFARCFNYDDSGKWNPPS